MFGNHPEVLNREELELLHSRGKLDKLPDDILEEAAEEIIGALDRYPLSIDEYLARCPKEWHEEALREPPMVKHWKPDDPSEFTPEFVLFIMSIRRRFCDLLPYKPFFNYIIQARNWVRENQWPDQYATDLEREHFYDLDFARRYNNTMYFADKYAKVKDGVLEGDNQFVTTLAHAHMFFIADCGYSTFEGKGRQIAASSANGVWVAAKLSTHKDILIVFIAHDKDSAITLIEDKVKYVISNLPDWAATEAINDKDGSMRVTFSIGGSKGQKKAMSSTVEPRTPTATAVNSRSPYAVLVDEAPFIDVFYDMMREARPAMYRFDPVTKTQKLKRQIKAYGTGGRTKQGKGIYERELRSVFAKWEAGNFSDAIVPIFYDWTCRPGINVEFYLSEQKAYASGTREGHTQYSLEERMVQFRQHYPCSVDDMFTEVVATLIPLSMLNKHLDRIGLYESRGVMCHVGRLDPVYGTVAMPPGSKHPFNITDVKWIPSHGDDLTAPVTIWQHPARGWRYRYYQGTDCIQHDAGQSKQASIVYDAHFGTLSAMVNFRSDNPDDVYEQTALLGMYYASKDERFIPELVENNYSAGYVAYKTGPWLDGDRSLVRKFELPDTLGGATSGREQNYINSIGWQTNASTKSRLIGVVKDMFNDHGSKFFIREVFTQLKHFVGRPTKGVQGTIWESEDSTRHQTDTIIASGLSYICRLSYSNRAPIEQQRFEEQMSKRSRPKTRVIIHPSLGPMTVRVNYDSTATSRRKAVRTIPGIQ